MSIVVGSIPKKITYVYKKPISCDIGCKWDIIQSNNKQKAIKLHPAFPVDSENKKSMDTAIKWAKSYSNDSYQIKEIDNDQITNVKIICLEIRGEGGRAYKIQIDDLLFDLREDVLVDAMIQVGIQPGGILNGKYVWAKVGSQTKLIRVDSELHKLILNYEKNSKTKVISKNDLEIGGVYQDKKKNNYIFLGFVNTTEFISKYKKSDRLYNKYYSNTEANLKFSSKEEKGLLCFINCWGDYTKSVSDLLTDKSYSTIEIKKTHSLIRKIGSKKIPKDLISSIREFYLQEIKNQVLQCLGVIPPPKGFSKIGSWDLEYNIIELSKIINMYEVDSDPVNVFNIETLKTFS